MSENPKIKKILLVFFVFALLLSAFYALDFKISQSETHVNSGLSAYSSGSPELNSSGRIYLYTEGEDALSVNLKEKLKEDLEAEGMEVIAINSIEEKYGSQALLVNVSRDKWLYTPVYASSNLNLAFFYTSTGEDTKYFEQFKNGNESVIFVNDGSGKGKMLMDGKIVVQDSTKGIISLKAYRKHLAEEAAGKTVEQLLQHINKLP
ncbi:hypothetical protein [Methanosarcina mazei]|jgi:hypothetical protein|uniref:Uncharacterized protein n=5 Tax=Methanosarcina mazei TaxID=2209 RepID=A0A0F8JZC0_METMZ|nr:hypothetical protein [Methanosarcina mazei]AAM30632.1 conserved protein [Methanosarcina mazei Go1]AKB60354.1 hypothetical protein MSMAP_0369 [Methanosarcina mazei SarPi]AKB63566.1 hypothetical protein MSMAS_0370 [Methanosarcina mazei S-6]AKB66924.1 hypothetical protein MSMAL_0381 [Methanosarcina mazei LYC]KKG03072.1 hypothetical protein DU40_05125 [Methanosarcina mazei]